MSQHWRQETALFERSPKDAGIIPLHLHNQRETDKTLKRLELDSLGKDTDK